MAPVKRQGESLPQVIVAKLVGVTDDGRLIAEAIPSNQRRLLSSFLITIDKPDREGNWPKSQDKILLRLASVHEDNRQIQGQIIRILGKDSHHGPSKQRVAIVNYLTHHEVELETIGGAHKPMKLWLKLANQSPEITQDLRLGHLVLLEIQSPHNTQIMRGKSRGRGCQDVRDNSAWSKALILNILGDGDDASLLSEISWREAGLVNEFPREVLREAESLYQRQPMPPETHLTKEREDWLSLPFVTIDGEDARDFDDAVAAMPDNDASNPQGMILWVAIADVAFYVPKGSLLDKEAARRGNSTYFPDRVIPMLPEILSNNLCSLRPHEIRPVVGVKMVLNQAGKIINSHFAQAIIKSQARLTYTDAQAWIDGDTQAMQRVWPEGDFAPLYKAWQALQAERKDRHVLGLTGEEWQVMFDQAGQPLRMQLRGQGAAHQLIEDMMIAANRTVASFLDEQGGGYLARIHPKPPKDKWESLKGWLISMGLTGPKANQPSVLWFNQLLAKLSDHPLKSLVNDMVLRSQAQAHYQLIDTKPPSSTPQTSAGHFGLGLLHYCHFTSPIRRYADLTVHRALLALLGLRKGIDSPSDLQLDWLADHLSGTERQSAAAERASLARFQSYLLKQQEGNSFQAIVVGSKDNIIFIKLIHSGAEGVIILNPRFLTQNRSTGKSSGRRFSSHSKSSHKSDQSKLTGNMLGSQVEVRLDKVNYLSGRMSFLLVESR